jgi:hypothetical protein
MTQPEFAIRAVQERDAPPPPLGKKRSYTFSTGNWISVTVFGSTWLPPEVRR